MTRHRFTDETEAAAAARRRRRRCGFERDNSLFIDGATSSSAVELVVDFLLDVDAEGRRGARLQCCRVTFVLPRPSGEMTSRTARPARCSSLH